MKRVEKRVYLDTNVSVFGRTNPLSNSRIILDLCEAGVLTVVISDTLLSEVKDVFTRLFGRKAGAFARFYVESLPNKVSVRDYEMQGAKDELSRYAVEEDLDHLAASKVTNADFLVTTDSRLLDSMAKETVQMVTPKRLLQELGLRSRDTEHEE